MRNQRPGHAFAGIFAVTFSGLLGVGAVLPVLPRYIHGRDWHTPGQLRELLRGL